MSDAAPPSWVRQLDLPSGAWRCLVGLWGFADYQREGTAEVWPSRETLAEATGQKPATVAKQLRKLRDLGWVDRLPSGVIVLAWRIPWSPERRPQSPDTTVTTPTTEGSPPTTTVTPFRRPQSPLTCKELPTTFQSTSTHSACATARTERHRAIAEQQLQLDADRAANRAHFAANPYAGVSDVFRANVGCIEEGGHQGAWLPWLDNDKWRAAMLRTLTVVAGWDLDDCVALMTTWSRKTDAGETRGLPPRDQLWSGFSTYRDWLMLHSGLKPEPAPRKGTVKLSAPRAGKAPGREGLKRVRRE